MKHQFGFTLVEVLVVVVIAVSVTAFAVPLYKQTQERNKFLAAQGVLMDIGTALQALRTDFVTANVDVNKVPEAKTRMLASHQTPCESCSYSTARNASELGDVSTTLTAYTLFARDYMQPIPYDGDNRYKGYQYYICPHEKYPETNHCCHLTSVACMHLGASCTSTTKQFKGAYVDEGGLVVPVETSSSEAERTSICGE